MIYLLKKNFNNLLHSSFKRNVNDHNVVNNHRQSTCAANEFDIILCLFMPLKCNKHLVKTHLNLRLTRFSGCSDPFKFFIRKLKTRKKAFDCFLESLNNFVCWFRISFICSIFQWTLTLRFGIRKIREFLYASGDGIFYCKPTETCDV